MNEKDYRIQAYKKVASLNSRSDEKDKDIKPVFSPVKTNDSVKSKLGVID